MRYRPIDAGEMPLAAELQARAFRGKVEEYRRAYGPDGRFDWRALRLLEDDGGQAVAAVTLFERPMSLNGGELNAGLVALLGVPPEQRRRGHARRLMDGILGELHGRQTPVSLLFPFSTAWYRSVGYGQANLTWYLTISPDRLPDPSLPLPSGEPERMAVRRAGPDDFGAIKACYERARQSPRNNGWLARSDWEWPHRLGLGPGEIPAAKAQFETVVFDAEGALEGYLVYTLTWEPSGSECRVLEWVWEGDRAWRGLAGFLASLGEQASRIVYNAPQGDPLLFAQPQPYASGDARAEFVFYPAARLVTGFMLRIVHLPTALTRRRYPAHVNAEFLLQIEDPQLPANRSPLHLAIRAGRGEVLPASGSRITHHTFRTDIATFGELYAGLLGAAQARTVGRLQADDAACAALTAAFAAAPLSMWQADWF